MPEVFNADSQTDTRADVSQQSTTDTTGAPVANAAAQNAAQNATGTANTAHTDAAATAASQEHHKRSIDEYSDVMRFEQPSRNPLLAFAAKPINVFFDTQEQEEQIILLLRQSLITQIRWVLITIGLSLFPFLIGALNVFQGLPGIYTAALTALWYLLTLGFALESFLSWFFNVYIITDERIIDVDFYSFIFKDVSNTKIINIEEVTAQTGGTLEAIFDFGTVFIQTASATSRIDFEDVPHPSKVTRLLNELLIEEEREEIEGRVR